MSFALVIDLVSDALLLGLMLAGPLLVTALATGILVSVFQAVTQIQEQTVSFVIKLAAVGTVFLFTLSWSLQTVVRYTVELFRSLPGLAG